MNLLGCNSKELVVPPADQIFQELRSKFSDAVWFLHYHGDRAKAAELFAEFARKYPSSRYGKESQELVTLLRKMVKEDKDWKEPNDITVLSTDEQILYWVYKVRDITLRSPFNPSYTRFIDWESRHRKPKHAGWKLLEIGKPAIPVLIKMLNDRRPTRTSGYHKFGYRSRTIQRYQDVALEILEKIFSNKFDKQRWGTTYFSDTSPEYRQKIIDEIKSYWEKVKDKSEK